MTASCCADCGKKEGGGGDISLKVCKACMGVRYCNAVCQRKHWATHKKQCKLRAAELRDEALFKDPPPKEDCPICFSPMPVSLISCVSLPAATVSSVPIHDYAITNKELAKEGMEECFVCCGKSVCKGCIHSCRESGTRKCPFCNAYRCSKTNEEMADEIMKRVEANDAASICLLANYYNHGLNGYQQDLAKAIDFFTKAAELGFSEAHCQLGDIYHEGGDLKKAKFHFGAAAMAGHELARYNLGSLEYKSGKMEQAVKHWTIAASAGEYDAMHELRLSFEEGSVSKESINSTLAAYNNSCVEMRSEARDACIRAITE